MASQQAPDALPSGSDGSQDRSNKRQRRQVTTEQAASGQVSALHMLPGAVASPSQDPGEASMPLPANTDYKHKPRRKATERPMGTDQIRQAFSKRKRGLALKCYQLHKLTDAKVFCFIMKEKGTSWAYATPGFGASLSASTLRQMRQLTGFDQASDASKQMTEVMPHPAAEAEVVDNGSTREIGVQVTSHIHTGYPGMGDGNVSTSGTDEVRNFVTELAHIAYSRGVPAGSIPMPAAAGNLEHLD
ncbi:hypothetical protein WJX79_006920 [Trebouxia sp. C0005]